MRTTLDLPDDLDRARGLGHGCGFRASALCSEPPGLDPYMADWVDGLGCGRWTDAYQAAFALAGLPVGELRWDFAG